MLIQPLFNVSFLASKWEAEYQAFNESKDAQALLERLKNWQARRQLSETATEAAFIKTFFCDIWEYAQQGDCPDGSYQCYPQFPIARAGQTGGTGAADLALGYFGSPEAELDIPQVLCEFKDIRSDLDRQQHRKGNTRTPVRQCMDYLREARNDLTGNELVEPFWGIVTDMNEFRLYCRTKGETQCQRFIIASRADIDEESLLCDSETGSFLRFLFRKMFHRSSLLAQQGDSYLKKLLKDQLIHETALEKDFYLEYKAYREFLYRTIMESNPQFTGTKGSLVRLTQRLLDRCLFLLFCEDMGKSLDFPDNLLRDILISYSRDPYYDPEDNVPWERLKNLFRVMDDGGTFGEQTINRFNGGLFQAFPELEQLKIPARVFCAKNQGAGGTETLLSHPLTLLFFTAKYNFGIKDASHQRVIDLYALGRIFEQSITELEIMEAEADGRPSVNLLSKRKRDGVYYTPEWVTAYIVKETVGARLQDMKNDLGLDPLLRPDQEAADKYRAFLEDRRKTAKAAASWIDALKRYRFWLNQLKVVDPACGSGAFLIQALEYLKKEHQWIIEESVRVTGQKELWDADEIINAILANNLYGVDINPESVEITKLALWMHTASPGKPLSDLDHNIRCGNSLVEPDFYKDVQQDLFSEDQKEQINTFDWKKAFPEVFNNGGFDCVIGNPPYVKLQHFRRVQASVAEYLVRAVREDGSPLYESTQTGNFDLYLLFIEKGLELLKPDGRMGFIAPSLWMMNDYGRGLRKKLKRTRQLDKWIDFKSFQVFEEAITYTALQFFTGYSREQIRCVFAPGGAQDIASVDWKGIKDIAIYQDLPSEEPWQLAPARQKELMLSLVTKNQKLGSIVDAISQGLISGAFWIFANVGLGQGRFLHTPKHQNGESSQREIEIEEQVVLDLATGDHIKRYQTVLTNLKIIFPYTKDGKARLLEPLEMESSFPKTWNFLGSYEEFLRNRDGGRLDDIHWYRYSRNQNLDKQPLPKLLIAGTAQTLLCTVDEEGKIAANDKRVYSVFPSSPIDLWFLAGILNSSVISFFFKKIARPKANGYYDIETQFLAPLPIPNTTEEQKGKVAEQARLLQNLHTKRRDLVSKWEQRLTSSQMEPDKRNETWFWADVGTVSSWKKSPQVPEGVKGAALTAWAKDMAAVKRERYYEEWDARLHRGASISVHNTDDELRLKIDDIPVLELFDEPDTPFIAAQWRLATRDLKITEKFTAKRLISRLLSLRKTEHAALKERIIAIDSEITALDQEIAEAEKAMNALVYRLYGLTPEEIAIVEAG
jgi:hypothetical protein